MPHFWIAIPTNPEPRKVRDKAQSVAKNHGAKLFGNEVFFKSDDLSTGYATIECDADRIDTVVHELGADGYEHVLTTDEAEAEEEQYESAD